jgi:hypothetical protein
MTRRLVTLALLFAVDAAARTAPSPVIFPPQKLPLVFSHKMHLRFKLQCDFCHDRAESSTSAADVLTPTEEPCRACHKIDRSQPHKEAIPEAACEACHVGTDPEHPQRVEVPAPFIKFNHKVHVDRRIPCERCHQGIDKLEMATRDELPRMPLCLGCHSRTATAGRAPAACSTCHLTDVDGKVRTALPTGTLVPSGTLRGDAHTPDFAVHHAQVASAGDSEKYCENCHRREFCLSCHNGLVKPLLFHGNDYLRIHAVEARKESLYCNACHRSATFCLGCHERAGLTDPRTVDAPNSLANAHPPGRYHPPFEVWTQAPRTPQHHSWQAQRNIRTCVACHREETCMECHSTPGAPGGGAGQLFHVSPHPAAYAGSRACTSMAARNGRVCLKCHAPSDPHINCR